MTFLVSISRNVSNANKQKAGINNDDGDNNNNKNNSNIKNSNANTNNNNSNSNYNRKCEQVTRNLSVWILSAASGAVGITTAELYSAKPELRFCACSNPAHHISEMVRISDGCPGWN